MLHQVAHQLLGVDNDAPCKSVSGITWEDQDRHNDIIKCCNVFIELGCNVDI